MASVSLFIVSTIVLFAMLLLFPKREERINAVEWSIVMLISVIGIWAFLAGCISLAGIRIDLWSLAIINVIVSIGLIALTAYRRKIQRFFVKWYDIVVVLVLFFIAVWVGCYRFGHDMSIFAYESDDSVRHFYNAKYIVLTGEIGSKRYILNLLNMILMSIGRAMTGTIDYQPFLITDIILWFLMGAMFFAMIRRFLKNGFHIVCAMVLTFAYTMAYPLNNMLHGFEYLGMGVLFISYLIWLVWEQDYLRLPAWMFISMLGLANYSILLSYTQFAPAVILGEIGYFVFALREKKNQKPITFLMMMVLGIGMPGLFCIRFIMPGAYDRFGWIIYLGIAMLLLIGGIFTGILAGRAKNKKTTIKEEYIRLLNVGIGTKKTGLIIGLVMLVAVLGVFAYKYIYIGMMVNYASTGLTLDGSIYREPYANFIWLCYPVVLYVCDSIKKKYNDVAIWILLGAVLESAWLIRYIYAGVIGSYYLYKMCYLIWLLLLACAVRILCIVSGERLKMLRTYMIIVLLFAVSTISNWEDKLTQRNVHLWPDSISNRIFGIYEYNAHLLQNGGNVNKGMQDIYNMVGEMVLATGEHVPYFGDDARHRREYYYYLTNQDPAMYLMEWNIGEGVDDIIETLKEYGIQHIFVAYDYDGLYMDELLELEGYYSTDYGRVVELH